MYRKQSKVACHDFNVFFTISVVMKWKISLVLCIFEQSSVVDKNILNLDSDPGFWLKLDPDPDVDPGQDPDPDPGLY